MSDEFRKLNKAEPDRTELEYPAAATESEALDLPSNPVAALDPNSPSFFEDAYALAQAEIEGDGDWEECARNFLAAVFMAEAQGVFDEGVR
jgi:hypothetical protein